MHPRTRILKPIAEAITTERFRRYVVRRDRQDRACQQRLGLDTFVADWDRLMQAPPAPNPPARTIWMLWLQGETEAPALVRACIESWRVRNPSWTVRVLDAESLVNTIALPRFPSHISPSHKADIIRLRLLARYGGVWADATTICQRPLDEWIDVTTPRGFFAFTRPQPLRSVANWFIAAHTDAPLLQAWLAWSETYMLSRRPARSYFWQHHTFDWLLARDPERQREWDETPKISARGPHVLQRLLDGHLSAQARPTAEQLASLPLFKLNRRKGYTLTDTRRIFLDYGLEPVDVSCESAPSAP
ncbi:capsular polysaccharide synthesis protein [Salinisphaera sp. Q1T1-3]|uniref:capsular polysaccharide synthesis protein n=1 Tax=Salinisphaera sp. Q1T1-3 TaxID=2321229 RepID=UPI0011C3F81E|nr:capsular polysaccharide synthesis protein [Salinisphaera sp. Q1T1-3]